MYDRLYVYAQSILGGPLYNLSCHGDLMGANETRNATETCDGGGTSRAWECLSLFVRRFEPEFGRIMGLAQRRQRRRQCLPHHTL